MKGAVLNLSRENCSLLSRRRAELIRRATPAEIHVRTLLESIGEKFIFQKGFLTEVRFFFVDFYLPKRRKLCLEIDGEYHERQIAYDKLRTKFLTAVRRFRVKRMTNSVALSMDSRSLIKFITP